MSEESNIEKAATRAAAGAAGAVGVGIGLFVILTTGGLGLVVGGSIIGGSTKALKFAATGKDED